MRAVGRNDLGDVKPSRLESYAYTVPASASSSARQTS
jgi:hypothetical protein